MPLVVFPPANLWSPIMPFSFRPGNTTATIITMALSLAMASCSPGAMEEAGGGDSGQKAELPSKMDVKKQVKVVRLRSESNLYVSPYEEDLKGKFQNAELSPDKKLGIVRVENGRLIFNESMWKAPLKVFEENGLVGLENAKGDVVLPPGMMSTDMMTYPFNGMIAVHSKLETPPWFIVDYKGERMDIERTRPLGFYQWQFSKLHPFLDKPGGLLGFKDAEGNVVVPAKYSTIGDYADGLIPVMERVKKDGGDSVEEWSYIDSEGKPAFGGKTFQHAESFYNHLSIVMERGGKDFSVIDDKGSIVMPPTYERLRHVVNSPGYFLARNGGGKWTIVDKKGERLDKTSYEDIKQLDKDILVYDMGAQGKHVANTRGEIINENLFEIVREVRRNLYIVKKAGNRPSYSLMDAFGQIHQNFEDEILSVNPNFKTVLVQNPMTKLVGVLDFSGAMVYPLELELVKPAASGKFVRLDKDVYFLKKKNKKGILGSDGKVLVDFEYDDIKPKPIWDDYVELDKDGEKGIYDLRKKRFKIPMSSADHIEFEGGGPLVIYRGKFADMYNSSFDYIKVKRDDINQACVDYSDEAFAKNRKVCKFYYCNVCFDAKAVETHNAADEAAATSNAQDSKEEAKENEGEAKPE